MSAGKEGAPQSGSSAGIHGNLHGLAQLTCDFRTGGPALTVQFEPAAPRGSAGDFLDDVPPGAVVLIDNHARADATVWGGIMTEIAAAARGIGGTVINGVCRDLNAALRQNHPLFNRGRFMRTGKDRVRLVAVNAHVVGRHPLGRT